jgi:hypothetical protein
MARLVEMDRRSTYDLWMRLQRLGIEDAHQLLSACKTGVDRHGMSAVLKVDIEQITRLVHRADLGRVAGLDDAAIDLLARAGVATLRALASSRAEWLYETLTTLDTEQGAQSGENTVSTPFSLGTVRCWIIEARRLPREVGD